MLKKWRANRATESAKPHALIQATDTPTSLPKPEIKLRSLAPEYKKEQHATYVRHLEAAVLDPKNKNIALTGRYGTGKSSILDNFLEEQEKKQKKTLRISINTLGSDDDDKDLTNRIQKELVKQLVYRAAPGQIRHSRFARRKDLTWWRILMEAVVCGIVVVGLLWLFGIRPVMDAFGDHHPAWSITAYVVLVVTAAAAARWVIGNRPISQFSTGGTSMSFEEQPDSYFDEYLDEIVAFFDATEPDLVIFEDLDRFDDPLIFDSLRELNTLVNASAHWKKREERPLRFVYAIKDSLFEKLGEDLRERDQEAQDPSTENAPTDDSDRRSTEPIAKMRRDTAEAAVERANRTKFFEIVVPVVPFLSHSNARDLLSEALNDLQLPADTVISRELLDLVARHATDMRLLINICNEFVVYAEKLLLVEKPAPGMTADDLFALVVYKNFHLADFEKLPNRSSNLDTLELYRRELVRKSIEQLQRDKQELLHANHLQREQDRVAQSLGARLTFLLTAMNHTLLNLSVGEQRHGTDAIHQPAFWKAVAEARKLSMLTRHSSGNTSNDYFDYERLKAVFPESLDPVQWGEVNAEDLAAQLASIDRDVAALRGADFSDLAKDKRYVTNGMSFDDHLEDVLESELARDLVRRGFVNRYYAEYSTVFYGKFIGVDVANFFRNSVWPNEMDIQFEFKTPQAVGNVLEQAPADFTSSRSVLNIEIVDHLLEHRREKAKEVVAFLVAEHGEDVLAFLDGFLNEAASRKKELIGLLAAHPWRGLFDHLARSDSFLDEDARTALLDAALLSARDADSYRLGEKACELIIERHSALTAFTEDQTEARTEIVFSFVRRAGLIAPSLRPLSKGLIRRVVEDRVYALTADNLRAALELSDDAAITLDRIRQHEAVWLRCSEDISAYFNTADEDEHTLYSVLSADVLSDVLEECHERWSDEQLAVLLDSSAPTAALPDITKVATEVWPAIVRADRVEPNAKNVYEYAQTRDVDDNLTRFLGNVDRLWSVDQLEPESRYKVALQMLNSSINPLKAVDLTEQLDLQREVSVSDLEPGKDDLLARLLEAQLVPDEQETFVHFIRRAGWPAVSEAFVVSERVEKFMSPALVSGVVPELLKDQRTPASIKTTVVKSLGEYVSDGNSDALREAGQYALKARVELPIDQVERIAAAGQAADAVVWQLDANKDLMAEDLLRTLAKLGGNYKGFGQGVDHQFNIRTSPEMGRILARLTKEKRVEAGETIQGLRKVRIIA